MFKRILEHYKTVRGISPTQKDLAVFRTLILLESELGELTNISDTALKVSWYVRYKPTYFRLGEHWWTYRPTGLSFWIANQRSFIEAFTRPSLHSDKLPFNRNEYDLIWNEYEKWCRKCVASYKI